MKKILIMLLVFTLVSFESICFANVQNDVSINLTQLSLNSKLRKDYKGYQYTIQNTGNEDINLINAQIINGVDGSVAYSTSSNNHPVAMVWAICGPVGLFTLGLGWFAGAIATPIVWSVSNSNNSKARMESNSYPNIVNLGYLKKGDVITVKTLVPIGSQPQLKLTVQSPKEKDLVFITK